MRLSMENKCIGGVPEETATATIKTNVNINSSNVIISKYKSNGDPFVLCVIVKGGINKECLLDIAIEDRHTIKFDTGDVGIFVVKQVWKGNKDVIPLVIDKSGTHTFIYLFIYCHLYSALSIVQCSNALYRL